MTQAQEKRTLPALRVRQWDKGWDEIAFDPAQRRAKPLPHFYLFSIPAVELRSLCGIYRRSAAKLASRTDDLGIQRQHDGERSEEISRFVQFGFPWSTISKAKRKTEEYHDLRKPGWLPTAIVINILRPDDVRRGNKVHEQDRIAITEDGDIARLLLPYPSWTGDWKSKELPPFEVIDGQHRLFAFDENSSLDFEVPVVAFHGLDISWQAYLFYTINIKPKRINPSLAFDLYPLLRSEDWLERAEGHSVYRETRAQEITESLWAHPESPWHDRINMLGERGVEGVSQSSWIKSIMATLIKPWTQRGSNTGGLFGSRLENEEEVLGWNRAQQAAFLIFSWREFQKAVFAHKAGWAQNLRAIRNTTEEKPQIDPAFGGSFSLIASDQGVRGFLQTLNDIAYFSAARWKLGDWHAELSSAAADNDAVTQALVTFEKTEAAGHVRELASALAAFDWRTSGTPDLDEHDRRRKLVFRGSGGYKELRLQLLEHLESSDNSFSELAKKIKNQVFEQ